MEDIWTLANLTLMGSAYSWELDNSLGLVLLGTRLHEGSSDLPPMLSIVVSDEDAAELLLQGMNLFTNRSEDLEIGLARKTFETIITEELSDGSYRYDFQLDQDTKAMREWLRDAVDDLKNYWHSDYLDQELRAERAEDEIYELHSEMEALNSYISALESETHDLQDQLSIAESEVSELENQIHELESSK